MQVKKQDIIWNYMGVLTAMLGNFLMLPFLLMYLENDILGLWYVFLSISALVVLFDFGFTPSFSRNFTYIISGAKALTTNNKSNVVESEIDYQLFKKLLSTSKMIYFIISLSAFLILIILGSLYIKYISSDLFDVTILASWLIFVFALFLNLYFGYNTALLRGIGAIAELNKASVYSYAIQIIFSIGSLYLGYGILGLAIGYFLKVVVNRIFNIYYFRKTQISYNLKHLGFDVKLSDVTSVFSKVWPNTWRDGFVSFSNYLSNQAIVLICPLFLTLSETGAYSLSLQLITALTSLATTIYNTYQPTLQAAYVKNDRLISVKLISISITSFIILYIMGIACIILIGFPIISAFNSELNISVAVFIFLAIYNLFLRHHMLYASFISNTNNIPYLKAFVISSILSIIGIFICLKYTDLGLWSVIIVPILIQGLYNNWKWPQVMMKTLDVSWKSIYINGLKELQLIVSEKWNYRRMVGKK